MKQRDKWTNAILVVLVVVLLAICIRSVVHEMRDNNQTETTKDGRNE
jgi:hypothetical protein